MRKVQLATLGSILVTAALAQAGTLYPRTQNVAVPPPRLRPAIAAPATSPAFTGISVMGMIGPPNFTVPPAPGEIAQLERALAASPGVPDPLADLASAYGRQMVFHQATAAAHTARATAATDPAVKARSTADAANELNQAKNMLLRMVKTSKALVDDDTYRNFPGMPDALFAYGFTLQSGRYMKEARAVYDRLLKNYPSSHHVPNAHFVFAEYYIEAGQLADAEARLKMVLKFPRSPAYWAAMYRLGYIHMQQQHHQEALETYFQVAMGTRGNAAMATLAEAARRGFVAAYVPIGKPDKAYAAFQRVDAARAVDMLAWLAEGYTQAGMTQQAHDIGAELARLRPTAAPVPATCAAAASAARAPGPTLAATVASIDALLRVRERLEAQRAMPSSVAAQCRADAIEIAGDAARALHLDAQKTSDLATYAAAVTLYTGYVDTIPDAPDAAAMRLLGAEAAWTLADLRHSPDLWDRAGIAFGKVVPRTTDSALAAVLAWKNALAADPSFAVQAGAFDLAALPAKLPPATSLDPRAAALVAAVDAYAAVATADDAELLRGRFLAATLYRGAHDYDRAAKILIDLEPRLGRRGDHTNRELAANLLLETLARGRQFDRVLQVADGFAADKAFIDRAPALRKSIEYLRSRSLRR